MAKIAGCRCRPVLVFLLTVLLQLAGWTNATSELEILPQGSLHKKSIGVSMLLTCNPKVENIKLITDIQWRDPQDRVIESLENQGYSNPTTYTELHEETKSLALFFTNLKEEQAGQYNCTAKYANNQELMSSVMVETIVAISWDEAPPNQYPILGEDFEIKCKVRARPSPSVDWIHNGNLIKTNDHFVIEPHGLRIKNVGESDDGVYRCRALVKDTGEFSERPIRVEVHVKPTILEFENPVQEIIEGDNANIVCNGTGKPLPKYGWVKLLTLQNLAKADRYGVDEDTGVLTITNVHRDDAGEYQCTAENAAGRATMNTRVVVIVKPKIISFENKTVNVENTTTLSCNAYGHPAPLITFRKHTNERSYEVGPQSDDDRVVVSNRVDGNGEMIGELTIDRIMRSDDGLYECIATNKGGAAIKNGHLTVEFAPTFDSMVNRTIWSWERRPVNLTCIAEAIPNATIKWFVGDEQIRDPNIKQIGIDAKSILNIIPVDRRYYTNYKCVASNKYGEEFRYIELREASRPGPLESSKISQITATTVTFELTPPPSQPDMPVTTITVQYKRDDQFWPAAKNRTWAVGKESFYHLDGLRPQTLYNFRFSAANEVGNGNWDRTITESTPMRTAPSVPKMLSKAPEGFDYDTSHYSNQYEVRWIVPLDNGEPIDLYEVAYCQVKRVSGEWDVLPTRCAKEHTRLLSNHHWLKNLYADSYYKVEVRAHNAMGYSEPSTMYIKLPRGGSTPVVHHKGPVLSSGAIIGIIIAVLIVIMLVIDVILCCCLKSGIIFYMCERSRRKPIDEEDAKLGRDEKEPLKEEKKITPIIDNGLRRETSVTYDGKTSISKTGFVGKDSAV